ncbi:MAG: TIGR02281 family clan AA aspartic protease [Rhodobacteraceae bacterium]|nr:TIGR02281 family clan AA aspartic protease [Paracoccaceae bacterium]
MESFEIADLIYLGLLLVFLVAGYRFARHGLSMAKMFGQASAWVAIFVVVIAGYGLWSDIQGSHGPRQSLVAATGQVSVPRHFDGHFYLTLKLNGTPVEFVVDTGATEVVLSEADARAVGVNLDALVFSGLAMTANGEVRTAPARINLVDLEGIEDKNLRVWVNQGEMDGSLLGMRYLRLYEKIEISGDTLILTR